MRRQLRNHACAVFALFAISAAAQDPGEAEPELFPPATAATTTYDAAIDALEIAVDEYFHALLRSTVAATGAEIDALETALQSKVANEFRSSALNFLTAREHVIHIKMIVLRQLHPEFGNDALPEDLDSTFADWEATRPDAIAGLLDRGDL